MRKKGKGKGYKGKGIGKGDGCKERRGKRRMGRK